MRVQIGEINIYLYVNIYINIYQNISAPSLSFIRSGRLPKVCERVCLTYLLLELTGYPQFTFTTLAEVINFIPDSL